MDQNPQSAFVALLHIPVTHFPDMETWSSHDFESDQTGSSSKSYIGRNLLQKRSDTHMTPHKQLQVKLKGFFFSPPSSFSTKPHYSACSPGFPFSSITTNLNIGGHQRRAWRQPLICVFGADYVWRESHAELCWVLLHSRNYTEGRRHLQCAKFYHLLSLRIDLVQYTTWFDFLSVC